MKKVVAGLFVVVLAFGFTPAKAQLADATYGYFMPGQEGGMFMGGVGLTQIDGQNYFSINLRPELAFGKFGLGLNVNLLYDTETGHVRTKDWDDSYDYFRLIRYFLGQLISLSKVFINVLTRYLTFLFKHHLET